jgi:pyrroline-5-carboxylate reductase
VELNGTLGFLGFGNMGSAILEGLIARGVIRGEQAAVYDPAPPCIEAAQRLGARVMPTPEALAEASDILVLAVKPQMMDAALGQIRAGLRTDTLVISIAAGISMAFIQQRLGAAVRVVRVMPNTPALVQAGAAGIAPGVNCTGEDVAAAHTIFEAVGIADLVSETDIDAVTAVSGSGPAYFFYLVECLVKAGVAEGLDEAVAARLAGQTLLGAGKLLMSRGESAAALREKVTSKGGTTAAALQQFQADGFETVVRAGVHAAAERSRELGA